MATLLPLRCVATLEAEIKKVDQQYDLCNEAWAKGEADKFASDEFLDVNHLSLLAKANTIPSHRLSSQFFLRQGLSRMRKPR